MNDSTQEFTLTIPNRMVDRLFGGLCCITGLLIFYGSFSGVIFVDEQGVSESAWSTISIGMLFVVGGLTLLMARRGLVIPKQAVTVVAWWGVPFRVWTATIPVDQVSLVRIRFNQYFRFIVSLEGADRDLFELRFPRVQIARGAAAEIAALLNVPCVDLTCESE